MELNTFFYLYDRYKLPPDKISKFKLSHFICNNNNIRVGVLKKKKKNEK